MVYINDYKIRNAKTLDGDIPRISRFYIENPTNEVREREEAQIIRSMDNDWFFIVEDEDLSIVGCCAIFDYLDGDYFELGGARVIANGYRLQQVLIWIRLLTIQIFEGGGKIIFTLHKDTAEASQRSIQVSGFIHWVPDSELLREREQICGGPVDEKVQFYVFSEAAIAKTAKSLLDLINQPVRVHKERQDSIRLDMEVPIVTDYRHILEELAKS